MGFFNNICEEYGPLVVHNMKQLMKNHKKLASLYNRRIFLLRCRRSQVRPNFINDSFKSLNSIITNSFNLNIRQILNLEKRFKNKILNLQINQIQTNIILLEREINNLKINIKETLPNYIYNKFIKKQINSYQKIFNKHKENCLNKYTKLNTENKEITYNQNWITNLTDMNIPKQVLAFLSLGPKFSIEPATNQLPIFKYLTQIESILESLDKDKHNIIRAKITNNITNWLKLPNIQNKFQQHYNITKSYLKNNPDLYVILSDKGKKVVIITKQQYNDKMLELINNTDKFKKLDKDPTNKLQILYNKTITSLEDNNIIKKSEATNLRIYNANAPKIFGQIKLHKTNNPLRPIVDNTGTIFSNLSKKLATTLTLAFKDQKNLILKDTFHLIEQLNNLQLPEDYILVSFDVINMFPSIPFQLIQYDINLNWKYIKKHTEVDKTTFLSLLKFIYDNNYFVYDNTYYKQLHGASMGSKLTPIQACRIIYNLFVTVTESLNFTLFFIKLFVDDSIAAVHKNKVQELLTALNNYNKDIQFTVEKEDKNKQINFLDTTITRDDNNKIKFKWFIKPTASQRYINYFSYCPLKYKLNLVKTLTHRIKQISHPDYLHNDLIRLQNILITNHYPLKLIKPIIFTTSNNVLITNNVQQNNQHTLHNNTDHKKYNSIYYLHNLTPNIKKLLKSENVSIAEKSLIKSKSIFTKTKQKTNNENLTDVIYKIKCSCNKVYVGNTSQKLSARLVQHKSNIKTRPKSCALANHIFHNKTHSFDKDNVEVLDIEHDSKRRLLLEMFHINLHIPNTINNRTDINNISNIYANLLQIEKLKKANQINTNVT